MKNVPDRLRQLVIERGAKLGLTPTGRATIEALRMNRPLILAIRYEEQARGRHP